MLLKLKEENVGDDNILKPVNERETSIGGGR